MNPKYKCQKTGTIVSMSYDPTDISHISHVTSEGINMKLLSRKCGAYRWGIFQCPACKSNCRDEEN